MNVKKTYLKSLAYRNSKLFFGKVALVSVGKMVMAFNLLQIISLCTCCKITCNHSRIHL